MNFDLAARIPPRARLVLDFGCARGEVGEAFLRISPETDYRGFETEPQTVQEAAGRLSQAICVEPKAVSLAHLGLASSSVDVMIVRGAYLRALTESSLRELAAFLREDGQLLLLLPNSGYVRTVLELLGGGHADGGFPSLDVLRSRIAAAGLFAGEVQPVYAAEADKELRESPEMRAFLQAFVGLCQREQRSVQTDVWAQGYFLRVLRRPVAERERILVHTALGEAIVTARVRVQEPGAFIATEPGVGVLAERGGYNEQVDRQFPHSILMRQRLMFNDFDEALRIIAEVRRRGYLLMAEIDDSPDVTERDPKKSDRLDFAGVHAVQVSTKALEELLQPFNPWVRTFPNHLRELPARRDYAAEAKRNGEDAVTIFFGALNRQQEWQDIMPVLNEMAREKGEKLQFQVLSDRSFFDALETEHKRFIGTEKDYGGQFVPYDVYQRALHTSDISLLPLHDTEFNRMKSDLKFIESAGHGAAALASPTVYDGSVRDGRTGFIYHDPREFAAYLRLLVEDRARRIETAEAAYLYVKRERLLSQHYLERLDWYRELFERRDEIDMALAARLEQVKKAHRRKAGKRKAGAGDDL